jgi:hypothetical protein
MNTRCRPSVGSAGMDQDGEPPPHVFININDAGGVQVIDSYIYEIEFLDGSHKYFCTCSHNAHPVAFDTRHDVVSHIRSEHLRGKSFLCTTWFEPPLFDPLEVTYYFQAVTRLSCESRMLSVMLPQRMTERSTNAVSGEKICSFFGYSIITILQPQSLLSQGLS